MGVRRGGRPRVGDFDGPGGGGRGDRERFDRGERPGPPDGAPPTAGPGSAREAPADPAARPDRGSAVASIIVDNAEIGFVIVPMAAPPVFVAIRELGPTLTWVGLGLLAIGAACAALLIFRPAHRRLRTLEQAARALGEGRTDVRAVEAGGDEVSSLAHTFNRMADDLERPRRRRSPHPIAPGVSSWPTSRTS